MTRSDSKKTNISPEALANQYETIRPAFASFTRKLHALIEELLARKDVKYSVVESRCKEVHSFIDKISRSGKQYSDPLNELADLAGVRIILYYTDDIERVGDLIREQFTIDEMASQDKAVFLEPHEFGYRSVHYVVSLSEIRRNLPEWDKHAGLKAEIQVRTVLQHAWAAISHVIDYKHELDVPSELRRELFRLSALLELADEQFLRLRMQKEAVVSKIGEQIEQNNLNIELNLDTIREFLLSAESVAEIVAEARAAGFKIKDTETFLSSFVAYCRDLNLETIQALESQLQMSPTWRSKYFSRLVARARKEGVTVWSGSRSFFVMLVVVAINRKVIDVKFLKDHGHWSPASATRVLETAEEVAIETQRLKGSRKSSRSVR